MITFIQGDSRSLPFPDNYFHCAVTSPPYWGLRAYLGDADPNREAELGRERTPEEYVENLMKVCREVWRVLRPDGTFWLNIGDNYIGSGGAGGDYNEGGIRDGQPRWKNQFKINRAKDRNAERWGGGNVPPSGFLKPKDMACIPWRVGLALQAEGWWLRNDIIWNKTSTYPESVEDRFPKAHEYILLLAKRNRYFFDHIAVREPAKQQSVERLNRALSSNHKSVNGAPGQTVQTINKPRPNKRLEKETISDFFDDSLVAPFDPSMGVNKRDVWSYPTGNFRGSHFATFHPAIPEVCILAATSAQGCCPKCGSPYKRIVRKKKPELRSINGHGPHSEQGQLGDARFDEPIEAVTLGWQPTCKCNAGEPVPCRVLDPFSGAGTTGLVCAEHRRDFVGVELNPDYIKLAQARMVGAQVEMNI